MADAPNDYRDPKVTTTADKKSSAGSILPWILLALGVLALLAWLLGLFGGDEDVTVVPVETTVEEPAVVVTPETTAPETTAPDANVVVNPDTTPTPETPAAPNATDVETTTVPITPAEPEAPAVDGTAVDPAAPVVVDPAAPVTE